MEHIIGETIEITKRNTHKVKVIEQQSCVGCYFMYYCKHENDKTIRMRYGECSELGRKDGKNIIFKLVE